MNRKNVIELNSKQPFFREMKFVIKAMCRDELRTNLCAISVRQGVIESADGHRIHKAEIDHQWTPGLYRLAMSYETKVLLIEEKGLQWPATYKFWHHDKVEFTKLYSINAALRHIYRATPINHEYLLDVLTDYDVWEFAVVEVADQRAALLKCDNMAAIIMSIKERGPDGSYVKQSKVIKKKDYVLDEWGCSEWMVIDAQKVVIEELQAIIRELPTWELVKEREDKIAELEGKSK
ncbi:hypothetical protein K9N50_11420 [bacterium]|nr:hypothetical protein [bacterium]